MCRGLLLIIVLSGVLNTLRDMFAEDVVGVIVGMKSVLHDDTEAMASNAKLVYETESASQTIFKVRLPYSITQYPHITLLPLPWTLFQQPPFWQALSSISKPIRRS